MPRIVQCSNECWQLIFHPGHKNVLRICTQSWHWYYYSLYYYNVKEGQTFSASHVRHSKIRASQMTPRMVTTFNFLDLQSHGDMMPCCNGEIVGSMRYDNLPLLVSLKLMMELPLKLNRQPSFSSLRLQKVRISSSISQPWRLTTWRPSREQVAWSWQLV